MGPLWTFAQVQGLLIQLQPMSRTFGYHVALGGGVLNRGESAKDADLYFLPMDDKHQTPDPDAMLAHLVSIWGASRPIGVIDPRYPPNKTYAYREIFQTQIGRIDAFIHKG